MRDEEYRINTYKRGRLALSTLKKDKNWNYWLSVIDALGEARREAFEAAGTNQPVGSAYNRAFGGILDREKLNGAVLDSATRNHCLQIAEKRAEVEAWRATLSMNLRQTLNHPGAVFKRWKRETTVPKPKEPKSTVRDSVASLDEQLAAVTRERDDAKRHAEELEASHENLKSRAIDDPFFALEALIIHRIGVDPEWLIQQLVETTGSASRFNANQLRDLASWVAELGLEVAKREKQTKPKAKRGRPRKITTVEAD